MSLVRNIAGGMPDKKDRKAYQAEHYRKNRERILARNKSHYEKHREEKSERVRLWREKHPDKPLQYVKKYHDTHLEQVRKHCRDWRLRNLESERARCRNKEAVRRTLKQKSAVNLAGINAWTKSLESKKSVRCYYCSKRISTKTIHIDHIIALSKGGPHSAENLCASCPSCNLSKKAKAISEWMRVGQQILSL